MVIDRAWETIRENIKVSTKESLSYHKLKKHKSWFDERNKDNADLYFVRLQNNVQTNVNWKNLHKYQKQLVELYFLSNTTAFSVQNIRLHLTGLI
jgi:hypothetical protein